MTMGAGLRGILLATSRQVDKSTSPRVHKLRAATAIKQRFYSPRINEQAEWEPVVAARSCLGEPSERRSGNESKSLFVASQWRKLFVEGVEWRPGLHARLPIGCALPRTEVGCNTCVRPASCRSLAS